MGGGGSGHVNERMDDFVTELTFPVSCRLLKGAAMERSRMKLKLEAAFYRSNGCSLSYANTASSSV